MREVIVHLWVKLCILCFWSKREGNQSTWWKHRLWFQNMPHTKARKFKPQLRLKTALCWWQVLARKVDMLSNTPCVTLSNVVWLVHMCGCGVCRNPAADEQRTTAEVCTVPDNRASLRGVAHRPAHCRWNPPGGVRNQSPARYEWTVPGSVLFTALRAKW